MLRINLKPLSAPVAALVLAFAALPIVSFARADDASSQSFLTRPDIHGNQIVFTAEGDLWLADVQTGEARRITSDPGLETNAHFSPDGTQIAFDASYDGGEEAYVMPTGGGIPRRLTYDGGQVVVQGWTPDGASVLFRTSSKLYAPEVEQFATAQLFTVAVGGGLPKLLAVPRGSFASLNHDGHRLAYVPTSNEWMNWFRYEAGEADQVWLADLSTGKFSQLTSSFGVDTQPVWAGEEIYFVSERSGVRNLWRLDPRSKQARQITFSTDLPVRNPSSDGHRVVYELGPYLEIYDPTIGKASRIPISLHSDRLHMRPHEAPVVPTDGAALGPAGTRVVIATQGQLVTVPATEGAMRSLVTDSGQRIREPRWSPDGKQIAYISDKSGEEELWTLGVAEDSTPKMVTKGLTGQNGAMVWSPDGKLILIGNRSGDTKLIDTVSGSIKLVNHSQGMLEYDGIQTDFKFSPDSKWVAYSTSTGGTNNVVELYEIATGKSTVLTDPMIQSGLADFSQDGKYLYLLQARDVSMTEQGISRRIADEYKMQVTGIALAADTPSPFLPKNEDEAEAPKKPSADKGGNTKVDLDGIADRYFDMKVPAGVYLGVASLPGKLLLAGPPGIQTFDIDKKVLTTIAAGVQPLDFTPDHKKMLVAGPAGLQVVDLNGAPVAPGAGAVKLAGLTVTVDPVPEWKEVLDEAWRVGRDFFYDPNMHGVDWKAVKRKYDAELVRVGSRDDLTRVIGDMISELNTGHCYVGGPSSFTRRAGRLGHLGIDLIYEPSTGMYRIKHILKGNAWDPSQRSPLAEVGMNVHEGDYLMKIRGQRLRSSQDPSALLVGTVGQTITVSVNSKPTTDGERTLAVVPIASEEDLRGQDWIDSRRAYVEKASGGQLGYVYVGDMSTLGAKQFAQQYYPQVDKAGLIVDVRGNGGGFISGNLLDDLSSKIDGYFTFRAGGNFRRAGWAPSGHVVAVTNEFAFSDGEYFSEFFKRLKIGPLIGHRTGGGEVGSGNGYRLMDGGDVFIPNYGAWVPGEWVVEGRGAVPDIEVDQDPAAVMAGKDPQLDKAIQVLMDDLKAHPFALPEHPKYPVKLKGSRGG